MNDAWPKWTWPTFAAGVATIACGLLIYAVIVSETISPTGRVLEPIALTVVPVILWIRAYRARR